MVSCIMHTTQSDPPRFLIIYTINNNNPTKDGRWFDIYMGYFQSGNINVYK